MLLENGYNMQNSSTNVYKYTYITQQCIFFIQGFKSEALVSQ